MAHTENYITQAAGDARYQQLGSLGSSNPSTIDPDDAASAGVSSSASRQDHQHPITTGTPANIGLTGVNSESSGTGFARDLHVHAYNPPACRVNNSAAQSIPNDTSTVLTFDTEVYDTDSMHSTSGNTSRITFTTAGVYDITGLISTAAGTDYTRIISSIRLNGTTIIAQEVYTPTTFNTLNQRQVSTKYKMSANDYVELLITQQNGAAASRNTDVSSVRPYFAATWIGVG